MRRLCLASHPLAASCAAISVFLAVVQMPARNAPPALAAVDHRNALPIILISVDTLRADRLSCYGYKRLSTSHIDRIGAGGTIFSQVNSQVPLTLPSHVSLLTSTYPFVNGVEDNGQQLAPNAVTLARVLKSRGYRTAAFVGGFVLDRRFGLDQGFDLYDEPSNPRSQGGKDPGDIKRFGEDVTRAATQWLDRSPDQPFFLFLHLYDLHTPYTLPASEQRRGVGYDAQLGYVDKVLGEFWAALEQRHMISRALVVFTGDHGESLHDHGESTHGYFVYQSTLRVPLIIHWPAGLPVFAAQVAEPVSLLDIAPTLLQIAGIDRPARFQGHNLVSLLAGTAATKSAASQEIYSESLYPHAHFGTAGLRALRIGRHKYIQAPRPEFYDLVEDPGEEHNLYETQKSMALAFRRRLELLRARYASTSTSRAAEPRPEVIAQLKSLGYLAGTESHASTFDSGVDPKDRITQYERYGRAIADANTGHLAASNATLEQLLDQDPGMVDVRLTLGLNQQRLGRHAEAAGNFKAVLKQVPSSAVPHFNLAVSENALGQQQDALKELEATLALAPNYLRAEEMLASLYLSNRDYERARSHLNHVMEVDPENYTANYNLGVLDCLQGNWQGGDRHLRAAIQSDPSSAEAYNTLGSLHLRRGDLDTARAELIEAIRLKPRFASAHYNLGLVLRRQGKKEEAAQEFHEALAADSSFQLAREALEHP